MDIIKRQTLAMVRKENIWIFIFLSSLGVMTVGVMSNLCLGDEVYHYRFAKDIFTQGKRVAFDPFFGRLFAQRNYYISPPLWHILLAYLWKIAGGISLFAAQIYHALYYALLLIFTYFLGKEIYGEEEGLYAMILVGTVPMIASFGVLLYVDVPLAALTALTFFLILKRRELFAGFGFGLMYLTKLHGLFFGLPFIFIILYLNEKERLLKKLVSFSLAALVIMIPDIYWREKHFHQEAFLGNSQDIVRFITYRGKKISESVKELLIPKAPPKFQTQEVSISTYYNSSFSRMTDQIKYFGLGLIPLLVLYFLWRRFSKKDLLLWLPVFLYFLCFIFVYGLRGDIRYLLYITPFLSVIASKTLLSLKGKRIKLVFLIVCLIQFLGVLSYVYAQRRISPETREVFNYVKASLPEDAIIVYPELTLTEYTHRKVVWYPMSWDLRKFLWDDDELIKDSLRNFHIDYILVKKTRIYDDTSIRHVGGYPLSFVNRLPGFRFLELEFENRELSLWRLRKEETH